jgi:hypothetical protein
MAPIAISDASKAALAAGVDEAAQARHVSGWVISLSAAGPSIVGRRKARKTTATTEAEDGVQTAFLR